MQKEEQLRRRDPKAHTVMMLERRERDFRLSQQYASSHSMPPAGVHPVAGTSQVRFGAPVVETGDTPCTVPMAPNATPGIESVLNPPLVASQILAVSPNLGQSKSELLSSTSETGQGTSVESAKQTQSRFFAPQHSSENSQFTTHDLQNHIDASNSFLGKVQRDRNVSDQPDRLDGQMEKAPLLVRYRTKHRKQGPGHSSGVTGHTTETTGTANASKENTGDRKRTVAADEQTPRKKTKRASAPTSDLLPPEAMFEKLLQVEASRPSRGSRS